MMMKLPTECRLNRVTINQGWLTSAVADGPAMGNEGAWLKRRARRAIIPYQAASLPAHGRRQARQQAETVYFSLLIVSP